MARFIRWAIKSRLIASSLEVTPHQRGSTRMSIDQQNAVIEQVVHQPAALHPRDRLAAILIIIFAQRPEDIIQLTWDRVTITADTVTLDLARPSARAAAATRSTRPSAGSPQP
jgi:hypothetical protein